MKARQTGYYPFAEPRFTTRPEWHLHFYDPETRIGGAIQSDADGEYYFTVRGSAAGGPPVESLLIAFEPNYHMSTAAKMGRMMPVQGPMAVAAE